MSESSEQTLRDTGRLTLTPIALIAVVAGIVAICFHVTTIDVEPVVKWTVELLLSVLGLPNLVLALRAPFVRITIKDDHVVNAGWRRTVLLNRSDIVDVDAGPYKGRWAQSGNRHAQRPLNLVLSQGMRVRVDALVVSTEHNVKVLELKVALGMA